jgi:hypothetical protein
MGASPVPLGTVKVTAHPSTGKSGNIEIIIIIINALIYATFSPKTARARYIVKRDELNTLSLVRPKE